MGIGPSRGSPSLEARSRYRIENDRLALVRVGVGVPVLRVGLRGGATLSCGIGVLSRGRPRRRRGLVVSGLLAFRVESREGLDQAAIEGLDGAPRLRGLCVVLRRGDGRDGLETPGLVARDLPKGANLGLPHPT